MNKNFAQSAAPKPRTSRSTQNAISIAILVILVIILIALAMSVSRVHAQAPPTPQPPSASSGTTPAAARVTPRAWHCNSYARASYRTCAPGQTPEPRSVQARRQAQGPQSGMLAGVVA